VARRSSGQVIERRTKRGTVYALRFYAAGQRRYETLGSAEDGWSRRRAEDELAAAMAAVRAGTWQPRQVVQEPGDVREAPTFHEFATDWFEANRHGWAARTEADYLWSLKHHLLPHFARHRLTDITVEEVDRYRASKLREGRLAPAQINKTLKRLSQILELAEEYEHIARNPARGKRRRVKAPKVPRSWVEPEQALTLMEAGSTYMRPVIATLLGAGLRVSEAVALDWTDVNLATGTLRVGKAKTDAGSYREVDLPGGLVEELSEWRARSRDDLADWQAQHGERAEPLFLSRHAGRVRRQSAANVARRLKTAIKRANGRLEALGIEPLSDRVTPHSLRRTFASMRAAAGEDPVYIAEQLGHTDPRFTLTVYTKAVKRKAKLHGAYLAGYERALAWAALPTAEKALTGTGARLEADQLSGARPETA
jgi:integrase